jgi:ADP-ribose pyrophosphatase YjhB (NUDIX family)
MKIGVVGIVERNGKFLLLKRSLAEEGLKGEWCLPGGEVLPNESPEDAIK